MHPLVQEVQKADLKRVPEIRTGYTIRVHQKIKEGGKERIQIFEGLVIKVGHGQGVEKTVTVRKVVEGIGVEKIFPMHSPNIAKVEVKKKAKVRRAKLYYMRQRSGKSARLQERHVTDAERAAEQAKMDAMIEEAVKADEKRKAEEVKADEVADTAETSGEAVETQQVASQAENVDAPENEEVKEPEADAGQPETEAEPEKEESKEAEPSDAKPGLESADAKSGEVEADAPEADETKEAESNDEEKAA